MPKNITAIKMRTPKCNPYTNVYQIKITLLDIKPSVWRRILVPETFTFQNLHDAIQDVMGWDDCHLHCFSVKTNKLTRGLQIGSRAQLDDDVMEESTTLKDVFDLTPITFRIPYLVNGMTTKATKATISKNMLKFLIFL